MKVRDLANSGLGGEGTASCRRKNPRNTLRRTPRGGRGFLLLEVILAMTLFTSAAIGLAIAIHRTSRAAQMTQSELRITRVMESALAEAISVPQLNEGSHSDSVGDSGIQLTTTITLLNDLKNKEGISLQEMYRVKITAHWLENGAEQERVAETLRYSRMYQAL